MASKTWYVLNTAAASPSWNGNLQDGGSAPADAACSFGFAPGKLAIGSYCKARLGASAAATATQTTSYISGAAGPAVGTGATITTAGDTFSPLVPYSGVFASGNWTFTWNARASTAGLVGRLGMRVWASTNANGSSARELTSGEVFSSSVTLSTSVNTNWAITWAAPTITLTNEYIFFQLEYQEQTSAGSSNNDNALFRVGSSIVTTNFANLIQGSVLFDPEPTLIVNEDLLMATKAALAPDVDFGADAWVYTFLYPPPLAPEVLLAADIDLVPGEVGGGTLWDGAALLVPEAVLAAAESMLQQATASANIAAAFTANEDLLMAVKAALAPISTLVVSAQIRSPIFASAAAATAFGVNEQMRLAAACQPRARGGHHRPRKHVS